jgi:hypothetical protein
MKEPLFRIIFIFIWLINAQANAQTHQLFIGKVLDFQTKEPLPFASIVLKNNNLGVFSNADGDFKISDNPSFRDDSLIVTFIGYRRYSFPFKNLRKNTTNTIYLKPIDVKLMEVNVVASAKKMNSKAIIRNAIKKIPENYMAQPNNYISYYRDYQKKDKIYYNLNEAIVQTQDKGINTSSLENRFWLLAFKENTDFRRMELSPYYDFLVSEDENANKFIKYGALPDQGGNELFILMNHDPIRRFRSKTFSFVNTFSKDFLSNHVFSNPTPVYNNDLMLYKISFTAKNYLTSDSLLIKGDIYIQPLTYSIHKLNYSGFYVLKGNAQKKMFDISIEYGQARSEDSNMELKYISFNNIFNVVDPTDTTYFRMVSSGLDPHDLTNAKVTLEFNHTIDSISAFNKDFYEVTFEDKKVKIKSIKVIGKKVLLNLFPEETHTLAPNLTVKTGKIKDVNGKVLWRRRNLEFYQYRELFVQEFNQHITFIGNCFMQNIPMIQNCVSQYAGNQKYWMNTPIQQDSLQTKE